MTTRIEPEILSREIVKPSSTGFNHPEAHTLSFFDQIYPPFYVPVLYFYANAEEGRINFHRSDALKNSLSAALSLYYPLAGRSNRDNGTVHCNDEGVLFIEARIRCKLLEALNHSPLREDTINLLFPDGLHCKDSNLSSPLVVQVTYFDCGGMAIAICISHSIMDMSSMCYFFNNWAAMTRKSGVPEVMTRPEFNFATFYPQGQVPEPVNHFEQVKCVSRTVVFDNAKIDKLKAMVEKKVVKNPTRVEVVTALTFKWAVSAADRARSSSGLMKPAVMHMPVNLRTRVCPPFSESAMGNFVGCASVSITREEISTLEWVQLVGKIRNGKQKCLDGCAKTSEGEALYNFVLESTKWMRESVGDQELYLFNTWCRFPFYEADFGWGKPAWVTPARTELKNSIHMMDTREGDGIEVMLCLEEQDMALFERDMDVIVWKIEKKSNKNHVRPEFILFSISRQKIFVV